MGWSASTAFTAEWSGASDDASGLAGYSVVIDGNPSSAADKSIEAGDSSGTGSFSTTLGEGAWHVHVRACDQAGNCAAGVAEDGFWGVDTSAPSAPGAVTSPSHGLIWSPKSNVIVDIEWGAAGDAVSAVAHYLYAFDHEPTGGCAGGSSSATLTGQSSALADGAWYAHVCAVDLAGNVGAVAHGGPWVVDTTPPAGLVVTSSSHAISTWSNDNGVDFVFSGATDANGVAGYAVAYDQSAATAPACANDQAGTSFIGSSSPDGDSWWIHVRALDEAGNCGDIVHLGPFFVDTVAPGTVSGLASTDHAVGLPSIDPTLAIAWTAATDDRSGVAAYSVQFDGGDGGDCDDTDDTSSPAFVSAPLAHGDWYARVCARDQAGNWGAVVSAGPYTIDLVAPQVLQVASTAATTDGLLTEGEVVGVAVTELRLTFDEKMSTAAGLATSYRLISAGGDGFQTLSCAGGVSPQDSSVAIGATALDGTGTLATLSVNGGVALPTGSYRLHACASLTDAAGNHLDGDGSGTPGDDFVRGFTVDRSPPQVTFVDSLAATAGPGLDQDEPTNVAIAQLAVTFSEPVYDPIGNTNPDDVTNPANYRLLASGGDGFQTVSCQAGIDAADVGVAIDAVAYDGPSRVATLAVNGGVALGEERYRLFVCGTAAIVDLAGLPLDGNADGAGGDDFARSFQVDTTAPSNPVLAPSLPAGVWTNLTGLTVTWSGAADDADGGGLAGYSVLFDLASGSDPGTGVDVAEAAAHEAAATLGDGASHHFHLRACDRAGNCAAAIEVGPFLIDTQVPAAASGLASASHDVGVASSDDTIEVSWSAALDQPGLSGIAGYGFLFAPGGDDDCDGVADGDETLLSTVSEPLADGEWWFHVCARDNAGNWGPRASIGPFVVDTSVAVVSIATVADTGDGVLDEGEATIGGVTQLLVAFDAAMADPAGDGAPEDVTNPANYRLLEAGADGALSTGACAAPAGDDVAVAVVSSEYLAASTTAVLRLAGTHALDAGSYRLLVCPTLEGETGAALSPFQRDFAVTVRDELGNPNLDGDLGGWVVTAATPGSLAWSAEDAGGASSSGSAEILAAGGVGEVWGLSQCFELPAGPFLGRARVQIESAAIDEPAVELRLDFYDAASCGGGLLGSTTSAPVVGDSGGLWSDLELERAAEPSTSQSVLVTARVLGGTAASFTARIDDLFYGRPLDLLSDGFETGDFRRWSEVAPGP